MSNVDVTVVKSDPVKVESPHVVIVDPAIGPDRDRLAELETIIDRCVQTFVEIGLALAEIREFKLYLGRYKTFEHYCQARWGWGASRSRQLIAGAITAKSLEGVTGVTPVNEAQARAINGVPEGKRAEVWKKAVEESKFRSIPITTAVLEVARSRAGAPPPVQRGVVGVDVDSTESFTSYMDLSYHERGKPTLYGKRINPRGPDANQLLYGVACKLRAFVQLPTALKLDISDVKPDDLRDHIKSLRETQATLSKLIKKLETST